LSSAVPTGSGASPGTPRSPAPSPTNETENRRPLGDLVGVTRQTSVLAYQLGDGFSNILTPTQGYFMAALALAGVPWTRWARFIWPLQLA